MKRSKILRLAKEILWDGEDEGELIGRGYYMFSCGAIGGARGTDFYQAQETSLYAARALNACGLDAWFAPEKRMEDMGLTQKQMQGARYMWLELLALECEEYGL